MSEQKQAGRELDAEIARRVLGSAVIRGGGYGHDFSFTDYPAVQVPSYSTEIAAAWEIVEWFRSRRYNVFLSAECGWQSAPGTPQFAVTIEWMADEPAVIESVFEVGATMPLAICRAALEARKERM